MSDQPSSSVLPDGRRVDDLKVTDLRKELELRGLSRSGVKKELCARLSNALDSDVPFCDATTNNKEKPSITENILEHVDDTLEIDALNSDEDVTDTSTNTVIHVPATNGSNSIDSYHRKISPVKAVVENSISKDVEPSSPNPPPNAPESNIPDNETVRPNTDAEVVPTSTQSLTRRRQWGMRNTPNSIPLSSESIQKLIPSPITPSTVGGNVEPPSGPNNDVSVAPEDKPIDDQAKPINKDNGLSAIEREEELEVHAVIESMDGDESAINDEPVREPPSDRSSHSKKSEKSSRESMKNERLDDNSESQERSTSRLSSQQPDYSSETSKDLLTKSSPVKRKGPKETKAVGYLVELPERIEPSQPAKHPQTDIVYIKFLVRPFTVDQLRQMVSRFGTVVDLWLDRIKSTSLVRMKSQEEASNCRDNLDGSRWPSMNPRVLRCDFASDELFEWMKANGDSGELQPPVHLVLGMKAPENPEPASKSRKSGSKQESSKGDNSSNDLRHRLERADRVSDPSRAARSKTYDIKDNPVVDSGGKTEEPAKLLNDLFCKTNATPSIYWLPLTKEQALKQNEERRRNYALKRSREASHSERKATRSPFANAASPQSHSPPNKSAKSEKSTHPVSKMSEPTKTTTESKKVPTTATDSSLTQSKPKPKVSKLENSIHSEKVMEKPVKPDVKNERSSDVHRKRERSPFTPDRKTQHSTSEPSDQPTSAKQSRGSLNSTNTSKQKISKSPEKLSKPNSTEKRESQQSSRVRSDSKTKQLNATDRHSEDTRRKSIPDSRSDRHRSRSSDKRTRSPSNGRYRSRR